MKHTPMLPLREKLKKIPRLFLTRKESRSVVINMTGSSMNDSRHKWKGSHRRKQVGFMLLGVLVPGVGVKIDCIHNLHIHLQVNTVDFHTNTWQQDTKKASYKYDTMC